MSRRRAITLAVLVALAVILVYSLLRQTRTPTVTSGQAGINGPKYVLQDADLTRYAADGQPRLWAHASQLDQYRGGLIVGTKLRVTTLHGADRWTATANHGELEHRGEPVLLTGDVEAHGHWPDSKQPLTIKTSKLWIDLSTHELYTPAMVTLVSKRRNGTAEGMRVNWLTESLSLLSKVHLDYEVPATD